MKLRLWLITVFVLLTCAQQVFAAETVKNIFLAPGSYYMLKLDEQILSIKSSDESALMTESLSSIFDNGFDVLVKVKKLGSKPFLNIKTQNNTYKFIFNSEMNVENMEIKDETPDKPPEAENKTFDFELDIPPEIKKGHQ